MLLALWLVAAAVFCAACYYFGRHVQRHRDLKYVHRIIETSNKYQKDRQEAEVDRDIWRGLACEAYIAMAAALQTHRLPTKEAHELQKTARAISAEAQRRS